MPKKRVTFYIDGFNFYNGLKDAARNNAMWRRYYWLDLVKFAEQFLGQDEELVSVKYFTAVPLKTDKAQRQSALFRANKFINGARIEFINGKYYTKPITCNACKGSFNLAEEKRTDVNISVHLMADSAQDKTDIFVLISADSDLVPPLDFITNAYPNKRIRVYFPPHRKSHDLAKYSSNGKAIYLFYNELKFRKAMLDEKVDEIEIPKHWNYKKPSV